MPSAVFNDFYVGALAGLLHGNSPTSLPTSNIFCASTYAYMHTDTHTHTDTWGQVFTATPKSCSELKFS